MIIALITVWCALSLLNSIHNEDDIHCQSCHQKCENDNLRKYQPAVSSLLPPSDVHEVNEREKDKEQI